MNCSGTVQLAKTGTHRALMGNASLLGEKRLKSRPNRQSAFLTILRRALQNAQLISSKRAIFRSHMKSKFVALSVNLMVAHRTEVDCFG